MSAFYDQASLVVVPSGYKSGKIYAQKPLTTDGQLTFTRASNATRIGPDGLIEKVRTNLLRYSQDFGNAIWGSFTGGTASAPVVTINNATAPDGTVTADTIVFNTGAGTTSSDRSVIYQDITISAGTYTSSLYARVTSGTGQLLFRGPNGSAYTTANLTTAWQRFDSVEIALSGTSNIEIGLRRGLVNEPINSSVTVEIWGAQMEVSDFGPTDYIATTTAAVSVGPVSGLPRLDYPTLGQSGSCPRLLLEPQRTNLVLYSEQFNNAWWVGAGSIVANTAISPSGYQDADTGNNVYPSSGIGDSTTIHTASIFAKANPSGASTLQLGMNRYAFGDFITCTFNLATGTAGAVTTGGTASSASAKIENYGNGWYRCSITGIASTSAGTLSFNPQNNCYIWGAQVEAGAYATSYIPTLSTSVTRVIDRFTKLSISSLINSQEGTLFVEMAALDSLMGTSILSLSDGSPNNNLYIGYTATTNQISSVFATGGVVQAVFNTTAFNVTQSNKIAVSYKANDLKMYVNGTLVGSDTSATMPAAGTLNEFSSDFGQGSFPLYANISQALIFPTALTATQLAELTTL